MQTEILRKLIRETLYHLLEAEAPQLVDGLYDKRSREYTQYDRYTQEDEIISNRNHVIQTVFLAMEKFKFDKLKLISVLNDLDKISEQEFATKLGIHIEPTADDIQRPGEFTYEYSMSDDRKQFARRVGLQVYDQIKDVRGRRPDETSDRDGTNIFYMTLKKLTDRIKVNLVRDIEPAPQDAPFEKYAFAQGRYRFPKEKDNDLEKKLAKLIKRHIFNNIPLPIQHFQMMMDLANQGLYKDILVKPAPDALIYRGLRKVDNSFIRSLGLDPETVTSGEHKVDATINPARSESNFVSSWTYNRDVAELFSKSGGQSGFNVILIASAGDNPDAFLECEIFAEEIDSIGADRLESSDELFGAGTIRLSGVVIERSDIQ